MLQTQITSAITLSAIMSDFASFNLWANKTIVDWLKQKPADLLDYEVPSSYSSIFKTLLHIWDCQRFWLSVIQQVPAPQSFREAFEGSLEDVLNGLIENSIEIAESIKTLSDEELQEDCYFNTPWIEGTAKKFEFLHHCLNHSTYHRGQVVTIGRNIGITDAPMTDYSFYILLVR